MNEWNALPCTTRHVMWGAALWMAHMAAASAAPAPWFWWVSKIDGQRVCAQHMPQQGWDRAEGPFQRADCKVPLRKGVLQR